MESKLSKIAILVDGDNAQPKLAEEVLEEVSKYGKVTIRRIYGDWSNPKMNGWNKDLLNNLSFNAIQKFEYTKGKNSTDSALIIDAMDILHGNTADGFCIVSSDSDYTGLAKRIRESGKFVMGIGEKKTPSAFVQSCEVFTFCENIAPQPEANGEPKVKTEETKTPTVKKDKYPPVDLKLINKAFERSVNESTEAHIATIGINLRRIHPSFDTRAYGFSTLTQLFNSLPDFEVVKNVTNGVNHPLVRRKSVD